MDKAQSLSVQTLIVVALGIIVLVISILLFNNYYDNADQTIGDCANQGGYCADSCPGMVNAAGTCPGAQRCCFSGVINRDS